MWISRPTYRRWPWEKEIMKHKLFWRYINLCKKYTWIMLNIYTTFNEGLVTHDLPFTITHVYTLIRWLVYYHNVINIKHYNECCICTRTRQGMYSKMWPQPKGSSQGSPRELSRLRSYFSVYPELSPYTDNVPFLTLIYWVFEYLSFRVQQLLFYIKIYRHAIKFTFCLAFCVSYINIFVFNCNCDTKNIVLFWC